MYGSGSTPGGLLVVAGDSLLTRSDDGQMMMNTFIWHVVDELKALDYNIESIQLSGEGSIANPHSWFVVMSK